MSKSIVRRRILAILAALAASVVSVSAGMAVRAAGLPELEPCIAKVDEYLNIRAGSSEDSEVIGKIYHNGVGRVLNVVKDGAWLRIRSGSVRGFVAAEYMAVGEEARILMEEAGSRTAQVQTAELNVYSEASDRADIVTIVPESTFLTIVEESDGWLNIETPYGISGWVKSDEVKTEISYSHGETLTAQEERLRRQETADRLAARESELWVTAQEALMGTADTKVAMMEAQMAREEAYIAFLKAGGTKEEALGIEEGTSAKEEDGDLASTYREAVEKEQNAKAAADADQEEAERKVDAATKASVSAQAAEKVAIEVTRIAPEGSPGCDYVTSRDHSIFFEKSVGQELVDYACQFVGNPYVWGGESLTNGCDCSGFTMLVYARYGITLPHFAQSQAAYGMAVSEEELEPGDLVFFQNGAEIYHVAIYIGNGTIVHAASSSTGIIFSDLHYSTSMLLFRRLL